MTVAADLGRELAKRLSAADTGTIGAIELAGHPFANFQLADNVPWTVLSPCSVEHLRAGRPERCPTNAQVLVTMQVKKRVNGNGEALMTSHLKSWDVLLGAIAVDEQVDALGDFRRHRFNPVHDEADLICQAAIRLTMETNP